MHVKLITVLPLLQFGQMQANKSLIGHCGFYCGRCVFYRLGEVKDAAQRLKLRLEGYEKYAARMGERFPELGDYPGFWKVLSWFADRDCHGCREGGGYEDCRVRTCCVDQGHEFCHECGKFPCGEMHESMIEKSLKLLRLGPERFIARETSRRGFE